MHGRIFHRRAVELAVALICGVTTTTHAQSIARLPAVPTPAYRVASHDTCRAVSYLTDGTPGGLSDRVAQLEAALREMQAKEAADRQEAAGRMTATVGGRIMIDWAAFGQNPTSILQAGDAYNGIEFRRARISVQGTGFHVIDYEIEVDFADQTAFKDVYLTFKELPYLQHVQIGHFYEAWGLERQTSSKYITFMERSVLDEVGEVGDRKTGVCTFGCSDAEDFTYKIGAWLAREDETPPGTLDSIYDDDGNTAFDARFTWLPWYDQRSDGRGLFHTGCSYTYRDIASLRNPAVGTRFEIAQQPESDLAPEVVDTGPLQDVNAVNAIRAEGALVYGPVSLQAEYAWYWLNRTASADARLDGGYVYVSYFLTGEHRGSYRPYGVFARVRPYENFFRMRDADGRIRMGRGAWELAYRVSYLNLNDASVQGGRLVDHTLGLNWYLNPYTRIMLNYIHSEVTDHPDAAGTGVMDIVQTRFQVDF